MIVNMKQNNTELLMSNTQVKHPPGTLTEQDNPFIYSDKGMNFLSYYSKEGVPF